MILCLSEYLVFKYLRARGRAKMINLRVNGCKHRDIDQ